MAAKKPQLVYSIDAMGRYWVMHKQEDGTYLPAFQIPFSLETDKQMCRSLWRDGTKEVHKAMDIKMMGLTR